MAKENEITFIAALNSTTAIKIDGEGQCKVTLEVPTSEIAEVMKLVLYVGKAFRVVILDTEQEDDYLKELKEMGNYIGKKWI